MAEPPITRSLCQELASLARLSMSDAQADRFAEQLGSIVEYLRQLRAVNVSDVLEWQPPVPACAPLRADEAGPMFPVDTVVQQAPAARGGQVLVPKFKED